MLRGGAWQRGGFPPATTNKQHAGQLVGGSSPEEKTLARVCTVVWELEAVGQGRERGVNIRNQILHVPHTPSHTHTHT